MEHAEEMSLRDDPVFGDSSGKRFKEADSQIQRVHVVRKSCDSAAKSSFHVSVLERLLNINAGEVLPAKSSSQAGLTMYGKWE